MGITAAVAAVVSAANAVYQGKKQEKAQEKQEDRAKAEADKQEQAMNRANQKKPDTVGALSAAQQSGKSGPSGTMLTGPQGVDPSSLNLGKNTLLGA